MSCSRYLAAATSRTDLRADCSSRVVLLPADCETRAFDLPPFPAKVKSCSCDALNSVCNLPQDSNGMMQQMLGILPIVNEDQLKAVRIDSCIRWHFAVNRKEMVP